MSIPVLDVHDLTGNPGATRTHEVTGMLEYLGSELVRVPDDAPVKARLLLESLVEGLLVSGRIEGIWILVCARCLTESPDTFSATVHELFTTDAQGDDDAYPYDPETGLDPAQMIRDAIGTQMPFAPLCRPDCAGLCEICGGNRNLGECPGHERMDPRFAVLADLVLPDLDT